MWIPSRVGFTNSLRCAEGWSKLHREQAIGREQARVHESHSKLKPGAEQLGEGLQVAFAHAIPLGKVGQKSGDELDGAVVGNAGIDREDFGHEFGLTLVAFGGGDFVVAQSGVQRLGAGE